MFAKMPIASAMERWLPCPSTDVCYVPEPPPAGYSRYGQGAIDECRAKHGKAE